MTKDKQMYSIIVRFPDELQDPIASAAKVTDRSINGFVVASVRRHLAHLAPSPADTLSASSEIGAFVSPVLTAGYEVQAASAE